MSRLALALSLFAFLSLVLACGGLSTPATTPPSGKAEEKTVAKDAGQPAVKTRDQVIWDWVRQHREAKYKQQLDAAAANYWEWKKIADRNPQDQDNQRALARSQAKWQAAKDESEAWRPSSTSRR